ncbi:cupin domain-containing protein [Aliinostoc sp. HNIBRCY26]|uniref:cupin domain-containing protein n=1 Tax=Aliinostoc sp. HNIBRCY26 TaxID=3418997 RepID=UPI003D08C574
MMQLNSENYCFCELAPLYALDLLDEQERNWVEQQIAECPELATELAEYELAVTVIPYTTPTVPMAADLKNRLFERLDLDTPEPTPAKEPATPPGFFAVRSQDLNWQPHDVPGVKIAILHIDQVKREVVGLFHAEPGIHYPCHRHAAIEEIYMISGDLMVDEQVYGAGDYIRSEPGSVHSPYTNGGCMFYFRTSMDDEYPSVRESVGV